MINLTKKMLHDTFLKIVDEGGSSRLTVKELTDRCGMSRNTFYYYYESIQSLMDQVIKEWLDSPVPKECVTPYECIEPLMKRCLANKKRILFILKTDYRFSLFENFNALTLRNLKVYMAHLENIDGPLKDQEFLESFFMRVFTGFIFYWLHKGMNEKNDIEAFSKLLGDAFTSLAEQNSQKGRSE